MLKTIVEDYISAALDQAVVSVNEDGFVSAYVEGYPGVRAHGDDVHECYKNLWVKVEQWATQWLRDGHPLPVFGGVDLNNERNAVLASYHEFRDQRQAGLERVFASHRSLIADLEAAEA